METLSEVNDGMEKNRRRLLIYWMAHCFAWERELIPNHCASVDCIDNVGSLTFSVEQYPCEDPHPEVGRA